MSKEKSTNRVVSVLVSAVIALLGTALVGAIWLYLFCTAINLQEPGLWILAAVLLFVYILLFRALQGHVDFGREIVTKAVGSKGRAKTYKKFNCNLKPYIVTLVPLVLLLLLAFFSDPLFNATAYASIRQVTTSDFSADLSESVGTDSIALMDTASAQMLGDREIGSLSHVVSQFDVSWDYTQIDYNGKPVKVAALDYAGFFKWWNNRHAGVEGYVTVDPVSMSASFHTCEGMKYVPSAFWGQDARRHLWQEYPTLMLDNLHFEIDEEGKPYYVASIIEKTVAVFGGHTVSGCVVMDPVTGDTVRYDVQDTPRWVDVVFDGNLLCEQYNWYGAYQNGYWNSVFAKKDCKQVTTYTVSENAEEDLEDDAPISDYGYVAKDGDIWIYTGITSVNGDSSNIGFLLANERTGESRYYAIAGADEKSAMAAAEGEVQEKRYQASFPSLINIDGHPTYIMVLKDSGGLVKLYATVNVEQYNLVTTADTQAECIAKYRQLLGIDQPEKPADDTTDTTVTLADIQHVVIDGNTYLYLIDTEDNIYRAKAADHESMLLLKVGDKVTLTHTGKTVLSYKTAEK